MHLKISVIISVYKRVDFLELVLLSLKRQTYTNFEVIIAEDAASEEMQTFINNQRPTFPFDIKHVFHDDQGFRKNKILNEAIRQAQGEYLIFIDGDCIVHRKFLRRYAERMKPDLCMFGRRVKLDQAITETLLQTRDLTLISLFRLFFSRSRMKEDALYLPFLANVRRRSKTIVGSNFCVLRQKMLLINGFDEDFERPYFGEDTDVRRRLLLAGVQMKSSKFIAIQYHLHHEIQATRADEDHNRELYNQKAQEGFYICANGIEKHLI